MYFFTSVRGINRQITFEGILEYWKMIWLAICTLAILINALKVSEQWKKIKFIRIFLNACLTYNIFHWSDISWIRKDCMRVASNIFILDTDTLPCASGDFHATLNFFLKKWIIYVSPQKSEPPSWKFYYSWDPVSVRRSPPTFYNNFQFPSNTVEFWFNNFIKSFYNFFLYKEKIFRSENIWNRKITVPQSYSCWDWWTARISGRMPEVGKKCW